MVKKGEEEETEETPKKKKEWEVNLVITNEEKPPKKVLVKGEETLDLYAAMAKLLNEVEHIEEVTLS